MSNSTNNAILIQKELESLRDWKEQSMIGLSLLEQCIEKYIDNRKHLSNSLEKLLTLHNREMEGLNTPSAREWYSAVTQAQDVLSKIKKS